MPVQWETVEVAIQGLDEKTDRTSVAAGKLVVAENVAFDAGVLRKRRGYLALQLVDDVVGTSIDPDNLFCAVGTVEDELVIMGYDRAYSVGSRQDAIDGAGLIDRGPLARGTLTVHHVSTGKETG